MVNDLLNANPDPIFHGPGEMRKLCRDYDWSASLLGSVALWPQSLRIATQMVLASPFPKIILWGSNLVQVYNDGYREIAGNKHPTGLGQPTQQIWPEAWHINESIYQRVMAGESLRFEDALFTLNRSGQLKDAWFTVAYSPILEESGKIGGVLVTVFETTQRILKDRVIQKYQAFLLNLSDSLRPLIDPVEIQTAAVNMLGETLKVDRCYYVEIDRVRQVMVVNREYLGSASHSLIGEHPLALFQKLVDLGASGNPIICHNIRTHPVLASEAEDYLARDVQGFVVVPLVKQGLVTGFMCMATEQPRNWARHEVQLLSEVTERTWATVERARAEAALRLEDRRKDEFLAMLSHQLRNPLTVLSNTLTYLERSKGKDADMSYSIGIERMSRQVRHLSHMVDDLLDISRIRQGKTNFQLQAIDFKTLLVQTVELARTLFIENNQVLEIAYPSQPVVVNGDTTRLSQVVMNLLINAAKYTEERGQIRITLEESDNKAILRVKDNGIGIPKEELGAIFKAFVQGDTSLHRTYEGLGLGLAVVKQIVEGHDGHIEARSAGLNQGSEFVMELPLFTGESDPSNPTVKIWSIASTAMQVLIVDDNSELIDLMGKIMELLGYDVHLCYNGQDGISAAETLNPDVLLLDIGMPYMDGYSVCEHIRKQPWGKNLPIIALTGFGLETDKLRSQAAGFDAHLLKPIDYTTLPDLLIETIAKKRESK